MWEERIAHTLTQELKQRDAIRLDDLLYRPTTAPSPQEWIWRNQAGEALIDYALLTYGNDTFPTLLRGLTAYTTWEDVLSDVYSADVNEFEAGWNQYMQEQYK